MEIYRSDYCSGFDPEGRKEKSGGKAQGARALRENVAHSSLLPASGVFVLVARFLEIR